MALASLVVGALVRSSEHELSEFDRPGMHMLPAPEHLGCQPGALVRKHALRERPRQLATRRAHRARPEEHLRQRFGAGCTRRRDQLIGAPGSFLVGRFVGPRLAHARIRRTRGRPVFCGAAFRT